MAWKFPTFFRRRPVAARVQTLVVGSQLDVERLESREMLATWDGGGLNNLWSNAANWVGDVGPAVGEDVYFNSDSANGRFNIDLGGATINVASINFNESGSNTSFVLSNGTLQTNTVVQADNGATHSISTAGLTTYNISTLTLDTAATATLNINAAITNQGVNPIGVTKTGTGTLNLQAANTFTGAFAAQSGTTNLTGAGNIAGASGVTIGSAGNTSLLFVNATDATTAVSLGTGNVNIGTGGGTGTLQVRRGLVTIAGNVTDSGTSTLLVDGASAALSGTAVATLSVNGAGANAVDTLNVGRQTDLITDTFSHAALNTIGTMSATNISIGVAAETNANVRGVWNASGSITSSNSFFIGITHTSTGSTAVGIVNASQNVTANGVAPVAAPNNNNSVSSLEVGFSNIGNSSATGTLNVGGLLTTTTARFGFAQATGSTGVASITTGNGFSVILLNAGWASAGNTTATASIVVNGGAVTWGDGSTLANLSRFNSSSDLDNSTVYSLLDFRNAASVTVNLGLNTPAAPSQGLRMGADAGGAGSTGHRIWSELLLSNTTNSITTGEFVLGNTPNANTGNVANNALNRVVFGAGTNTVVASSIWVGAQNSLGEMTIAAGGTVQITTGSLIASKNDLTSTAAGSGTLDFTPGTVNGSLGAVVLGQHTTGSGSATGTFRMDQGTVTASSLNVGQAIGATATAVGTLEIAGTASFTVNGNANIGSTSSGGASATGTGTVTVNDGTFAVTGTTIVGSAISGSGTANGTLDQNGGAVNLASVTVANAASGTAVGLIDVSAGVLTVTGTMNVGVTTGATGMATGTFNLSGTGTANVTGAITAASNAASVGGTAVANGNINVSGGTLNALNNLTVGVTSSVVALSTGTSNADLNLSGTGVINVTGTFIGATVNGGAGAVDADINISGGTLTVSGATTLGINNGTNGNANGTLTQTGGQVNLQSAAAGASTIASVVEATGEILVHAGTFIATGLILGDVRTSAAGNARGRLLVDGTGAVTINGNLVVGTTSVTTPSTATGIVDVAGTLTVTGTTTLGLVAGLGGIASGTLTQTGGTVNLVNTTVGRTNAGSGTASALIQVDDGALNVTGDLTLGHIVNSAGDATGRLTVNGGTVQVAGALTVAKSTNSTTGATGYVNVSAGTVTVTGNTVIADLDSNSGQAFADFNQTGGTVNLANVLVASSNTTGTGNADGTLNISGTSVTNITGTLTLGEIAGTAGTAHGKLFVANSSNVAVAGNVTAGIAAAGTGVATGDLTIQGGTLALAGNLALGNTQGATGTATGNLDVSGGLITVLAVTMGNEVDPAATAAGTITQSGGTLQARSIGKGTGTASYTANTTGGTLRNEAGQDLTLTDIAMTVNAGATQTLQASGTNAIHFAGTSAISGAGNVLKTETGTLNLINNNPFTGTFEIQNGTVNLTGAGNLSGASGITIGSGSAANNATLFVNATAPGTAVALGVGNVTQGANGSTGTLLIRQGTVTIGGNLLDAGGTTALIVDGASAGAFPGTPTARLSVNGISGTNSVDRVEVAFQNADVTPGEDARATVTLANGLTASSVQVGSTTDANGLSSVHGTLTVLGGAVNVTTGAAAANVFRAGYMAGVDIDGGERATGIIDFSGASSVTLNLGTKTLELGRVISKINTDGDNATNAAAAGDLRFSNTGLNTVTAGAVIAGESLDNGAVLNHVTPSRIQLGRQNAWTVNSITVGGMRGAGQMAFASAGANSLTVVGNTVTNVDLFVGRNNAGGGTGTIGSGVLDLSLGSFTATLGTVVVGLSIQTNAPNGLGSGTFSMSAGTVTATSLSVGQTSAVAQTAAGVATGIFNLSGGTFTVSGASTFGSILGSTGTATGTLNLSGTGSFSAASILLGSEAIGGTATGDINQSGTSTLRTDLLDRGDTGAHTYNWTGGTIGNRAGSNLVSTDVVITSTGNGGQTFDITGANTGTLQSGSYVTGTGGFIKTGSGSLTLMANNTFTGEARIQTGAVNLTGAGNLTGASDIFVGEGSAANTALLFVNATAFDTVVTLGVGDVIMGTAGSTGTLQIRQGVANIAGNLIDAGGTTALIVDGATAGTVDAASNTLATLNVNGVGGTNSVDSIRVGVQDDIIAELNGKAAATFANGFTTASVEVGTTTDTGGATRVIGTLTVTDGVVDVTGNTFRVGTMAGAVQVLGGWTTGATGTVNFSGADSVNINLGTNSILLGHSLLSAALASNQGTADGHVTFSAAGPNTVRAASVVVGYSNDNSFAIQNTGASFTLTSDIVLGQNNTWNVNTVTIGSLRSRGSMSFANAGSVFNLDGSTAGQTTLNIGTNNTGSASSTNGNGMVDLTLGDFNSDLGTVTIGAFTNGTSGSGTGTLLMASGTVTADALVVGTGVSTVNGTLTLSGDAIFTVDGNAILGRTTGAAGSVTGNLNVFGTAQFTANTITLATEADAAANAIGNITQTGGTITANAITRGTNTGIATYTGTGGTLANRTGGDLTITDLTNFRLNGNVTFNISAGQNGSFVNTTMVTTAGTGNLIKAGDGTLTLDSAHTYTGSTTVAAGTLLVTNTVGSNATGNGTVTVQNGATLAGTGQVAAVAVQAGGTLSAGATAGATGTFTIVGALTIADNGILVVDILSAADHDLIVAGSAAVNGATVAGTSASVPFGAHILIIDVTGLVAVSGLLDTPITLSGRTYTQVIDNLDLYFDKTSTTRVWDGGAGDGLWSSAANWVGDQAPDEGDALSFGAVAGTATNNNFANGTFFTQIIFTVSGYTLNGNGITLIEGLVNNAASGTNVINFTITTDGDQTFSTVAGGTLDLNGAVTLGGNLDLAGPGNIEIGAVTGAFDMTTSGGGTATLAGPISVASLQTAATGSTQINAATITTTGTQTYQNNVTLLVDTNLTGTTVSFNGDLTGGGNDLTVTGNGNLGDTVADTISGIGALAVTGNADFNAAIAADSVAVTGTTSIDGGSVTTSGSQTYTGAASLGQNTTLTGPSVSFGDNLDGNSFALSLTGDGTFGDGTGTDAVTEVGALVVGANADFNATISAASVAVTGTTSVDGGNVTTTGTQTYTGAVTLGNATTGFTGAGITFNNTVTGAGVAATITDSATTTFGGNVTLGSLTTTAGGTTAINAAQVTTTGAQTFGDAVTLGTAATTLAGSALSFANTLTGAANNLQLNAAGATSFQGNVTLASVTTDAGGTTSFAPGIAVTTSGNQTFGDDVTVTGNYSHVLTGGTANLQFGTALNVGPHTMTVQGAGGDVVLATATNLGGGTLQTTGMDVRVTSGSTFTGAGTVSLNNQNVFSVAGMLSPGASPGTLNVQNVTAGFTDPVFELRAGGSMFIELTPSGGDVVNVTRAGGLGAASLLGSVVFVIDLQFGATNFPDPGSFYYFVNGTLGSSNPTLSVLSPDINGNLVNYGVTSLFTAFDQGSAATGGGSSAEMAVVYVAGQGVALVQVGQVFRFIETPPPVAQPVFLVPVPAVSVPVVTQVVNTAPVVVDDRVGQSEDQGNGLAEVEIVEIPSFSYQSPEGTDPEADPNVRVVVSNQVVKLRELASVLRRLEKEPFGIYRVMIRLLDKPGNEQVIEIELTAQNRAAVMARLNSMWKILEFNLRTNDGAIPAAESEPGNEQPADAAPAAAAPEAQPLETSAIDVQSSGLEGAVSYDSSLDAEPTDSREALFASGLPLLMLGGMAVNQVASLFGKRERKYAEHSDLWFSRIAPKRKMK